MTPESMVSEAVLDTRVRRRMALNCNTNCNYAAHRGALLVPLTVVMLL